MPGAQPVLVVDDTSSFREMVTKTLTRRGYRVTSATNGLEALDLLRNAFEPYIVLLDLVMPVLDGTGVLREIEADPDLAHAGHRIIIMSSTPQLAAQYANAIRARLAKPFTPGQLIAIVDAERIA